MRTISTQDLVLKINLITKSHHDNEISKGEALTSLYRLQSRCKTEVNWGRGRVSYLSNLPQLVMVEKAMQVVFNR